MQNIAKIRRRHKINGDSISSLAEEFKHSRTTIRKHLNSVEEPVYQRQHQPLPKLSEFEAQLVAWLEYDAQLLRKQRRTAQRLFECIQEEGYVGTYSPVQRYVKVWKKSQGKNPAAKQAFVPLSFPPGETCQFDWSHETVVLAGISQTVKVAHFRLTSSC